MDTRAVEKIDVLLRTYDDKFTMAEWWRRMTAAQAGRRKRTLLAQFVSDGELVFDVGANRGAMTLTFRQLGAQVIAVEPLFAAAPHLVREFAWKFGEDGEVIPVASAIADEKKTVIFSVQKNLPYLSSCDVPWMTKSAHARMYNSTSCRRVPVKTTTLDALIEKYGEPAFVKIDVEGYEGVAIRGLSRPVKALSFEFHQDWLHDAVEVCAHLDILYPRYEYNYALDFRGMLVLDEWVDRSQLIAHLKHTLTKKGRGSWGDVYVRAVPIAIG